VLAELQMDCAAPAGETPEIACLSDCCTQCCYSDGTNCNPNTYFE
jgi:hypothetical protein